MAKKIKQFRFYRNNDPRNWPQKINDEDETRLVEYNDYVDGNIFKDRKAIFDERVDEDKTYPIAQLGIQGLPGTKFFINGSIDPITIGVSGIYDLDIKNGIRITELQFWQRSMENINKSTTGYLIVDILCGEED